jgi:hypothetical protein
MIFLDRVSTHTDSNIPAGVRLLCSAPVKANPDDRRPSWEKEHMEARSLRGIPGGFDYLISETAKKQEPQSEGAHQKASEGKAEQVAVTTAIRDR